MLEYSESSSSSRLVKSDSDYLPGDVSVSGDILAIFVGCYSMISGLIALISISIGIEIETILA